MLEDLKLFDLDFLELSVILWIMNWHRISYRYYQRQVMYFILTSLFIDLKIVLKTSCYIRLLTNVIITFYTVLPQKLIFYAYWINLVKKTKLKPEQKPERMKRREYNSFVHTQFIYYLFRNTLGSCVQFSQIYFFLQQYNLKLRLLIYKIISVGSWEVLFLKTFIKKPFRFLVISIGKSCF